MTEIIIKDHSKRIIVKGRNGSIYRKQNSSACGGGEVQRQFSGTEASISDALNTIKTQKKVFKFIFVSKEIMS